MKQTKSIFIYLLVVLLCTPIFAQTQAPNPEIQYSLIDSLKHELQIAKHDTTRIQLLRKIGKALNYTPESLPYYEQALQLSKTINNKTLEAECCNGIGIVQAKQSNYDHAIKYYLQSLKINEELNNKAGIASSLGNIGIVYQLQGDYDLAIKYNLQSLKIEEELNNKAGIASSLNNIGVVYRLQGDYDLAIKYNHQSLKIQEELNNKAGIAMSLNNIGIVYELQGDYDLAIKYYLQSLKINEELNNKAGIASSLNNIGAVYYYRSQKDSALLYFKSSLKIMEETGNKEGIALGLSNIGELYAELGKYKEALDCLDSSLVIAKEIGAKVGIMEASANLAGTYEKLGRHDTAFSYHKLSSQYKDSLFNEEQNKEIGKLEASYEFEKAETEKKRIEETNARIQKEEKERTDNIQYIGIVLFLALVFAGIIVFTLRAVKPGKVGRDDIFLKDVISARYLRALEISSWVGFILLFEFVLILLNSRIEALTGNIPVWKVLLNCLVAGGLYLVQLFLEKLLKKGLGAPALEHTSLTKGTFLFTLMLAMSLGHVYFFTAGFTQIINPKSQIQNSLIDSLKHELQIAKHDTTRIQLLRKIGDALHDTPESLPYYEQALQLCKTINNKAGIASSLNNIGIVYKLQGDYDLAIKYYLQSLKINEELSNKAGIASSLNNIGIVYKLQGDYDLAIKYYLQSLKINEELNNKAGIANSLGNIGIVYEIQGDYDLAIKHYLQSLKIDEELNNKTGIAMNVNNIGNVYQFQGDYDLAINYYLQSLKIAEELNNKAGIASSLGNIGIVYCYRAQKDSALLYFKSTLKIMEETGNKEGIAASLSNIGEIYAELGKYKEALEYLDSSLVISREIGAKYYIMGISENLSNTHAKINKYKIACKHFLVFCTYKDSIFNEEKSKKISKMQTKHDLEMASIKRKHQQEETARIAAEEQELRDKIQYSSITISGFVLIGLLLLISNFILPVWLIELLTYIPFLLLFETLLSFLDPLVANYTGASPAWTLLVNGVLAIGLFPVHSFTESRLKRKFLVRKRGARMKNNRRREKL